MNIKEIKEMINLMNENGLTELEVEKDDMRIRLKKTANGIEGFDGQAVLPGQGLTTSGSYRPARSMLRTSLASLLLPIRLGLSG